MSAIRGVVRGGKLVVSIPADWPDGAQVTLALDRDEPTQMTEENWPTTPEGCAALAARMEALGTGWLSPEDDAAWRQALAEKREFEKANFFSHAARLSGGES